MKKLIKKVSDFNNPGNFLFCLGMIFLPSAVPIGVFFLTIALIISLSKTKSAIFQDKWNFPLFLSTGLIIASCIKNTIELVASNSSELEISTIWLNLFNWLPLFLSFWGFQEFLKNRLQRKLFAYSLLIGTIPVVISCIGQNWFEWYGPFKTFYGTIIWYQKPLITNLGISGLFSNQNYAGFWLSSIFPFALAIFLKRRGFNFLSFAFFCNSFIIFYLVILTSSRNSVLAVISSFPFLISIKIFLLILLIIIASLPIYLYVIPTINEILGIELKITPDKLFEREYGAIQNEPRIEIYSKTLKLIRQKPLLGWGGSSFAFIYILYEGISNAQHAHNLSLQIALDYGLPLSILLSSTIFILFFKAFRKIIPLRKENDFYIDKALLASSYISLFFHLSDIPYYDARVSILIWTLLASLKCILDEYKTYDKFN